MSSKNHKKDYFPFDVYIDNENFKKFIIFGYKIINKELDKGEKLFFLILVYMILIMQDQKFYLLIHHN